MPPLEGSFVMLAAFCSIGLPDPEAVVRWGVEVLVEADFTAPAFLLETGTFITLAALGVGTVLHCHLPAASDHDWPSLALWYVSVWLIILPNGSRSRTCPCVLDKPSLVSAEKNALNECAGRSVPVGNT
jgi:hypothetical protein